MDDPILRTVNWTPGLSIAPLHLEALERLSLARAGIDSYGLYRGAGLLSVSAGDALEVDVQYDDQDKVLAVEVRRLLAVDGRGALLEIGPGNALRVQRPAPDLATQKTVFVTLRPDPRQHHTLYDQHLDDRKYRLIEEPPCRLPRYRLELRVGRFEPRPDEFTIASLVYDPQERRCDNAPDFLPHSHAYGCTAGLRAAGQELGGRLQHAVQTVWQASTRTDGSGIAACSLILNQLSQVRLALGRGIEGPRGLAERFQVLSTQLSLGQGPLGGLAAAPQRRPDPRDARSDQRYCQATLDWLERVAAALPLAVQPAAPAPPPPAAFDYRTALELWEEKDFEMRGKDCRPQAVFPLERTEEGYWGEFWVDADYKDLVFLLNESAPQSQGSIPFALEIRDSDNRSLGRKSLNLKVEVQGHRNFLAEQVPFKPSERMRGSHMLLTGLPRSMVCTAVMVVSHPLRLRR